MSLLKTLIDDFDKIQGDTLENSVKSMFNILNEKEYELKYILKADILNIDSFKTFIIMELCPDEENPDISSIMNLTMEEIENWYNYIIRNYEDKEIIYQTIHSTKGLEYDNVVIELDDDFVHDKKYFARFFENYENEIDLETKERQKFLNARNLFYVGVTRAVSNLAIYYKNDNNLMEILKSVCN